MANLAQMYGYNTDWKPGGSLGGFLASQRENELELARLMEMYNSAQQLQKQKQDYNYNEQMNPLNIQGKGLANTTAQQSLDMNAPKAAKALAQVADPNWLPGEMKSDRIKGEAEDTENLAKTQANKRARVMSLFEKWAAGNTPQAEVLFDIEQFDPSERQMLLQASKDPAAALEVMLEQDAQRSWSKDKVKTTQNNLTALEIANINRERGIQVAGINSGNRSQKTLDLEKYYVQSMNEWLAAGQPNEGPVLTKYLTAYKAYRDSENADNSRPFSQITNQGLQSGAPVPLPENPPGIKQGTPKAEQKADPLGIRK